MAKKKSAPPHPADRPASWVEETLATAERRLAVRLTLYDMTGLFHDEAGYSLLGPMRASHRRWVVCGVGRLATRCEAHCRGRVNAQAGRQEEPFVHVCWKGLAEIVVPLWWRGRRQATLFAGSWRPAQVRRGAPPRGQPDRFSKAYAELPILDETTAAELGGLLSLLGQGILARLDEERLGRAASRPLSREEIIQRFLRYRAGETVHLEDLAEELHLTTSRTSHLVKELCGESFQELLKNERLRRAKALLLSTDLTGREIAARVGLPNEYHFNRLFRASFGLPPGQFRRRATSGRTGGAE